MVLVLYARSVRRWPDLQVDGVLSLPRRRRVLLQRDKVLQIREETRGIMLIRSGCRLIIGVPLSARCSHRRMPRVSLATP